MRAGAPITGAGSKAYLRGHGFRAAAAAVAFAVDAGAPLPDSSVNTTAK